MSAVLPARLVELAGPCGSARVGTPDLQFPSLQQFPLSLFPMQNLIRQQIQSPHLHTIQGLVALTASFREVPQWPRRSQLKRRLSEENTFLSSDILQIFANVLNTPLLCMTYP